MMGEDVYEGRKKKKETEKKKKRPEGENGLWLTGK